MFDPVAYADGQALGEELIHLQGRIDELQLRFACIASEFCRLDYYMEEGFTTPLNWIRVNCNLNLPTAADRVAVGDCRPKLRESEQAMESGQIGFAHLVVLARTSQAVRDSFDERDLLDKARENTPGRLHHICESYRHAKDPARFAQSQAEVVEQRKLKLSTWPNGILSLDGYLDAAGGAALRSALEPLARRSGADDCRTREQRLADALVELVTSRQRVNLQVTSSVETLLGLVGSPAAETEFSLPISAATVERWACDCNLTRILLGGESTVIEVGRSRRTVEGPTRRALDARDRHCRWPGCDRPARWTTPHHLKHWTNGGTTDLPNLLLLCGRHHWMVHEGKWQIIKTDDGRVLTMPPPTRFRPYVSVAESAQPLRE
jgi:hypothetical protein